MSKLNSQLSAIKGHNRLLVEVRLEPVQGDRFQTTGFPDIGAAIYTAPNGTPKLLVESAQSVANRLEETLLGHDHELLPEFTGLSYVKSHVIGEADVWTNSLVEPHRLNSPYIISEFAETFAQETGYEKMGAQIDWPKIARVIYKYDVNSLLHGVFFANLEKGGSLIRLSRAVSGFIEASGVEEVISGGVKIDRVDATGKIAPTVKSEYFKDKDVNGNVPYHRTEYTAKNIRAYFNIDLDLLRSYGLGEDAFNLLVSLAIYKISKFLETGLRLRTACDLKVVEGSFVIEPKDFEWPSSEEAKEAVRYYIQQTRDMFAENNGVTVLEVPAKLKKSKKETQSEAE